MEDGLVENCSSCDTFFFVFSDHSGSHFLLLLAILKEQKKFWTIFKGLFQRNKFIAPTCFKLHFTTNLTILILYFFHYVITANLDDFYV